MSHLAIHAQDFLNAYKILKGSNNAFVERVARDAGESHQKTAFGSIPAMGIDIVCLAFSVELHIKELHRAFSGEIPRGHNIGKLFSMLPASTQEAIVSHDSIARYGWNDSQIEIELRAISDGFEKWRYAYESVSLRYNEYFAIALISAARGVLLGDVD